jgi:hypothetical protein
MTNRMRRLRYLSLGAGVQSTALALMIAHGEIEPVDCAIFADTQWEPAEVYTHLAWLESVIPTLPHPFPIYRVTAGSLRDHVLAGVRVADSDPQFDEDRYRGIPAYVRPGSDGRPLGMVRRQCTREYKIAPITRKVREMLGVQPGGRVPSSTLVEQLTGISSDEADRAKPAQEPWLVRLYPLLDRRISRMGCIAWMRAHGYPDPPRSSCIGCPLHTRAEWRRMRAEDPASFADAVEVDEAIRGGLVGGIRAREVYLHSTGRPLVDAVADTTAQEGLFTERPMANECEGMCGV